MGKSDSENCPESDSIPFEDKGIEVISQNCQKQDEQNAVGRSMMVAAGIADEDPRDEVEIWKIPQNNPKSRPAKPTYLIRLSIGKGEGNEAVGDG